MIDEHVVRSVSEPTAGVHVLLAIAQDNVVGNVGMPEHERVESPREYLGRRHLERGVVGNFTTEDAVVSRHHHEHQLLPGVPCAHERGEEPQRDPNLDWGENLPPLPDQHAVIGYLPADERFDAKAKALKERLQRISVETGMRTSIRFAEIAEEEWAESWKEHFHPLKIGDKVVIKPTWREYARNTQDILIEIDPGMAFGTGTHATTALCIQMIEKYIQTGDSFLDIGTGSGILMVTAAKLGAGHVRGTDQDQNAVEIARQNLTLNKIDPERFRVRAGNLTDGIQGRFDLVAANILTKVILTLLGDLRRVLADGGLFICSGILEESASRVKDKMRDLDFEVIESQTQEDWVVIVGRDRKQRAER